METPTTPNKSILTRFRDKKRKDHEQLANIHNTLMGQKPFPIPQSQADCKGAKALCFKDSLLGGTILLVLIVILDTIYSALGNVLIYTLLWVGMVTAVYVKNRLRYQSHCATVLAGGDHHAH